MTKLSSDSSRLRLFGMRNLQLESDLKKVEDSGVDIQHCSQLRKDDIVDRDLFASDILVSAKKMADFYVLYYSLENSIRELIRGVLKDKYGPNWWDEKVPNGVKDEVKNKQKKEKDTVLAIRSEEDQLLYTNFGELIDILNTNWPDFEDGIRSRKSMQGILSQFNLIRNVIAHSCELSEDDISRFKLLIKDWLRIQT